MVGYFFKSSSTNIVTLSSSFIVSDEKSVFPT